jgi:hypothetical protein
VIRAEFRNLQGWHVHHHWLGAGLLLILVGTVISSQISNPFTTLGRAIDIGLELWAVLVVAGCAGAFAAFLQDADRPR